jgi:hypothetical protein
LKHTQIALDISKWRRQGRITPCLLKIIDALNQFLFFSEANPIKPLAKSHPAPGI